MNNASINEDRRADRESMVTETPQAYINNDMVGESVYGEAPTRPIDNNPREITIKPLSSGYYVKVGCQEVAVESTEKLITMLNAYLSNPSNFEKKWYSKDVRNKLDNI